MKIILSKGEMLEVLKNSFPTAMIPIDHEVSDVKETGYPPSVEITISKKEVT